MRVAVVVWSLKRSLPAPSPFPLPVEIRFQFRPFWELFRRLSQVPSVELASTRREGSAEARVSRICRGAPGVVMPMPIAPLLLVIAPPDTFASEVSNGARAGLG